MFFVLETGKEAAEMAECIVWGCVSSVAVRKASQVIAFPRPTIPRMCYRVNKISELTESTRISGGKKNQNLVAGVRWEWPADLLIQDGLAARRWQPSGLKILTNEPKVNSRAV